jgi:septum formation protein
MQAQDPAPLVCLASVSARRRALLAQIGVPHVVSAADIDEALLPGEPAADYVVRMARAKALAVRERGMALPVLAADTTVVVDEMVCGKPADEAEGLAMLERLSGRTHQVLTAVALAAHGAVSFRLSASEVRWRRLSRAECAAYWHTGEPRDKAGGYAVQGLGGRLVAAVDGCFTNVIGLPLTTTRALLSRRGLL